jgi:hypothetical protein
MPQELIDSYGHDITYQQVVPQNSPTITNPGTADPTGTTAALIPGQVSDGVGLFQITTAGTQTTGALRVITFAKVYEALRFSAAAVSTLAGVSGGGVITTTMTASTLTISVGTALTTATVYQVYYRIF